MNILKSLIILYFTASKFFGTCFCETRNLMKNPRIVIVGAGAAGVAAASKLFQNGFTNIILLEAEDRIGGRVFTTRFGNYLVDMGGQWVSGQQGNIAYELAHPFGLLDESDPFEEEYLVHYYDSNGNQLISEIEDKINYFIENYVNDIKVKENDSYKSIGEFMESKFNEVFKNDPEVLNEREKYLHFLQSERLTEDSADSWFNVSVKETKKLLKHYQGNELTNWKEKGYSLILDILMKRFPNPRKELPIKNNTLLNTEVMSIDYLNNTEGPPVLVTTTKGELFRADHVIVTVSLGVLKEKHKSLFIPPLPDYKVAAIEGIGFGTVAKIYLLFDKPFWKVKDKQQVGFNFIWNKSTKNELNADPEKRWLVGASGAYAVEHKPNLLSVWCSSIYSKEMETLPEHKVFNHVVETLHRFIDKSYNVTTPIAMLRTRWFTNPHFRGTYSYRSLEAEREKLLPEMLERPLRSDSLTVLFAGEATSTDRWGFVDGAIGSGWKAANRLIELYKKDV